MAKYISFTITDSANSGLGAASAFQDGVNLIPVDQITYVTQTDAVTAKVFLNSLVGFDVLTVVAGIASTGAAGVPTTVSAPLLKDSITYAMSANPGGVVAKVSLGLDDGTIANGNPATGVRMYWRSYTLAAT
tara:strand:+ start:108 stop:503 length:396 start_codon:yes stop_codon:yes gene_type:complete